MFSTDFIFRQQENLVDNQKCQAGFRPLCNKILLRVSSKQIERTPCSTYCKKIILKCKHKGNLLDCLGKHGKLICFLSFYFHHENNS